LRGDRIPPSDHLALHCQQSGMEIDAGGVPVGITREALRVDEDGISTNWIEYDAGDFSTSCLILATVRRVRKNHRVGVIKVGEAIDLGHAQKKSLTLFMIRSNHRNCPIPRTPC
jgi:hypothetical protein